MLRVFGTRKAKNMNLLRLCEIQAAYMRSDAHIYAINYRYRKASLHPLHSRVPYFAYAFAPMYCNARKQVGD